ASARDRESALAAAERLAAPLETLVEQGAIGGFDSAARYLPPLAVQRARQASLPPPTEIGARLREALSGAPVSASRLEPFVLDLKAEADRLYSSYFTEAARLALAGLGAIVLLLVLALRSPGRVARVVAPLALAVLAVAGVLVALGGRLTILHLVGMLLIVAV